MKHLWTAAIVALVCGGFYFAMAPLSARRHAGAPGFEDLVPCAFLTSLDSKRSLYLAGHHEARISDKGGGETTWATGTWALVDDDAHTYMIDIDGTKTTYTLVSAPEGEGCMLAAGDLASADLRRSWFSALTDPK